jgi:acetyl-CoA acetyltransferase
VQLEAEASDMTIESVAILGACRTPFGRFGGAFRDLPAVELGAVAVGHPVGATGARILMTLVFELRRRGGGRGVATLCGAGANGCAVVVEAP